MDFTKECDREEMIRIEINYSMRNHILPIEKRKTNTENYLASFEKEERIKNAAFLTNFGD
ncbi:hypothetical protein FACS1894174_09150 [Bacteroidia bacterium]|nr:hypothetical protein FACS1894174_09150 [Bacteroidia bacterium]